MRKSQILFSIFILCTSLIFVNCQQGPKGDPGPAGADGLAGQDGDDAPVFADGVGELTAVIVGARMSNGTPFGGTIENDTVIVTRAFEAFEQSNQFEIGESGSYLELSLLDSTARKEITISFDFDFDVTTLSEINIADVTYGYLGVRTYKDVGNTIHVWNGDSYYEPLATPPRSDFTINTLTYDSSTSEVTVDLTINLIGNTDPPSTGSVKGKVKVIEIRR